MLGSRLPMCSSAVKHQTSTPRALLAHEQKTAPSNTNTPMLLQVNLSTDVNNCGAVGRVCSTFNGAPSCSGGQCSITCSAGFADVNGPAANDGCEVNLSTDPSNCGAVGNVCTKGANVASVACSNSTCTIASCVLGFTDTDKAYATGCEVRP